MDLPPVTQEPTGQRHPGKFIWHDLLTPDTLAARTFYGELFGWSFREESGYIQILNGSRPIGGMLRIRPQQREKVEAQWLASMSVPDLENAADQVESSGGRIINGPLDLGMRGTALLIADPDGAQLLLLDTRGGDPEDREPGLGDWLWNELWTLQPDRAAAFYRKLGKYEEVLKGEGYRVLLNEGHWRAGIRRIESPTYAGRWVPVVRVEDPASLLKKVESLGGTVWVRPEESRNGQTALISDNTGALLILQHWEFPSGAEK